ncbi:MAG TPA: alpha/beta hydrolase [Microthrixaceae bacterium]|nr:alpha/beta hydrolase [Microthrixaceae bacterium]
MNEAPDSDTSVDGNPGPDAFGVGPNADPARSKVHEAETSRFATHEDTPARVESSIVDGLAVTRRRRPDVNPGRPTVFLVHGAMDRSASFGRVMRRLVEFDVIAYDRRGYAGSMVAGSRGAAHDGARDPIPDAIQQNADDLRTIIDWSGATNAVVIGHSLGGTIALALAAGGQANLISLGVFEAPAPWLDGSFADVGRGAVEVAESEGDEQGAEFFYRLMIGDKSYSRLRDRDKQARRAEGPALLAELRSLRDPSHAIDLGSIKLPTIVGTGSTTSPSLRRGSELLTEALPNAWGIEIAGSGHGAHLTHPNDFGAFVRACVARGEILVEPAPANTDQNG